MTEKTQSQLGRLINKIAQKFPMTEDPIVLTDIHIRVNQETGDAMAYDDDNKEITRVVIDEWIGNAEKEGKFNQQVAKALRKVLHAEKVSKELGIIMPYSFVLENESGEHIDELLVADNDETVIIGGEFMKDLEKDLDDFMRKLMEE